MLEFLPTGIVGLARPNLQVGAQDVTTSGSGALRSPNFQFLQMVAPLVELGSRAERYALEDPNTATIKVRQLGELLAQSVAAKFGIETASAGKPHAGFPLLDRSATQVASAHWQTVSGKHARRP